MSTTAPSPLVAAVRPLLEQAIAAGITAGAAVAVTDRTADLCQVASGVQAPGAPMQPDSVFRIASMTKVMTSLAVCLLADAKQIDLDAPLSRYVAEFRQPEVITGLDEASGRPLTRPARSAITLRQLLTHTSGYGYWFLDAALLQVVGQEPDLLASPFLVDEPGRAFHYGVSTDVLATVIEPVAGMPFATFLSERILVPLGMADTGFDRPATARLTAIFDRTAEGLRPLPLEAYGPAPRGGGGLYSTASDYTRLLRLFLNHGLVNGQQLISPAGCAAMLSNQVGAIFAPMQCSVVPQRSNDFVFMHGRHQFGLGFALETEDQPGGRSAGSGSWAGIFNTYFWLDPRAGIAATVMMQQKPFADHRCVELYRDVEQAIYAAL